VHAPSNTELQLITHTASTTKRVLLRLLLQAALQTVNTLCTASALFELLFLHHCLWALFALADVPQLKLAAAAGAIAAAVVTAAVAVRRATSPTARRRAVPLQQRLPLLLAALLAAASTTATINSSLKAAVEADIGSTAVRCCCTAATAATAAALRLAAVALSVLSVAVHQAACNADVQPSEVQRIVHVVCP
jgi:hypothetical protein